MGSTTLAVVDRGGRALTAEEFQALADVPDVDVWLANFDSSHTRRAYRRDVQEFMALIGIKGPEDFRAVRRSHVLLWRKYMEAQGLGKSARRRRLAALSSLYRYLCENNAADDNPVTGVKRPKANEKKGLTPALSADQARTLLSAPRGDSLKAKRDRAILAVFLLHAPRREEVSRLTVGSIFYELGTPHFRIEGKGGKTRDVVAHPEALAAITEYLEADGRGSDPDEPMFLPIKDNTSDRRGSGAITPDGLYWIVSTHAKAAGLPINRALHALRATAATNALGNDADLKRVMDWLGHANLSTTQLYDQRDTLPQDSPTFKVSY